MNKRMNRNKLNIGTYFLKSWANTEQHVKDLKDCGIDFVVCMQNDRIVLDLFLKYGIGAIVEGVFPHWWGGNGENAGTMEKEIPLSVYDERLKTFEDHPAIWAIDVADEPSAKDFRHLGRILDKVDKMYENQFGYLNLYPNYASFAKNDAAETMNQLGTKTYREHIDLYCENVGADYISYDFYPYSWENTGIAKMYDNLYVVADACQKTGKSLWIIPQVNTMWEDLIMSENHLRFQAFVSMAFGAENITWACYTKGWWLYNVLDEDGNKTEQYDKLKKVNAEIKILADKYMEYKRVNTHFVGFDVSDEEIKNINIIPKKVLNTGVFFDVCAEEKIVAGQMVSRKGENKFALFIVGADDSYDRNNKEYELHFTVENRKVTVTGARNELQYLGDNKYSIKIRSNEGILIEAE